MGIMSDLSLLIATNGNVPWAVNVPQDHKKTIQTVLFTVGGYASTFIEECSLSHIDGLVQDCSNSNELAI